jgi:hypothetical protein
MVKKCEVFANWSEEDITPVDYIYHIVAAVVSSVGALHALSMTVGGCGLRDLSFDLASDSTANR